MTQNGGSRKNLALKSLFYRPVSAEVTPSEDASTLTDVSGQRGVRPGQGGRGAGEDQAFPVTGPAAGTQTAAVRSIRVCIVAPRRGATLSLTAARGGGADWDGSL